MKITDLMLKQAIKLELSASSKMEVIEELIDMLYGAERITNKDKFKKAILKREKQSTTGIGEGVAIPHAKNKYVKEPTIAFGYSKDGIDYESMDGNPAHLFFMIAVPEAGENLHLQALGKLARMLTHEDFILGLQSSKTSEEVIELINKIDK